MGYLISETTKEEREAIVAESLGNIEAKRCALIGAASFLARLIASASVFTTLFMPTIRSTCFGP